MAEPIHLELLADFFNRIGQKQTFFGVSPVGPLPG
jgi:hypothetical protein